MDYSPFYLLVIAMTDATILVLIFRTRALVGHLLSMVEPLLGDGTMEQQEPLKRAVRDKRGRIVRWETYAPPAGAIGAGRVAESSGSSDSDVPIGDLLAKWQEGTLTKADVLPHLPAILGRLKGEFSPRGGGGGGGGAETRSRFG